MKETQIMKEIMVVASQLGARLFRNNNGVLRNERGHYIRFGLGPGTSDLIGWMPDGRFLAVETKTPGSSTEKDRLQMQKDFIAQVNSTCLGVGFLAYSVAEFVEKFNERRKN